MEILRALATSDRKVVDVVDGLKTVCTLLQNIFDKPEESRFRSIRRTNPKIAPLLGREEEGLLRAAGFEDAEGEELICKQADDLSHRVAASFLEVLEATKLAHAVLKEKADEAASQVACAKTCPIKAALNATGGKAAAAGLLCRDSAVASGLECALLDYVSQRSAETAETEKRQRRAAEAEAVRSPSGWREAFHRANGVSLCDGGSLEAWLDKDASNRVLAYDLLQLQSAAVRWYSDGAQRRCEEWFQLLSQLSSVGGEVPGFDSIFREELQCLREALFEFPERPGAVPGLFRKTTSVQGTPTDCCEASADAECSVVTPMPTPSRERELVAVE